MTVGSRIKEIRVKRKETLEQFATNIQKETDFKIKTTKSNVSKWEKGLNIPNDITLKAIAELGNVTVDYILNMSETITISKKEYNELLEFKFMYEQLLK